MLPILKFLQNKTCVLVILFFSITGLTIGGFKIFQQQLKSFFVPAIIVQGIQISPDLTYYYSGVIGGIDGASKVAVDNSGRIYVTCCNWGEMRIYDQNKNFIKKFDATNPKIGEGALRGIFVDGDGKIYIASGAGYVQIFDLDGNFLKGIGKERTATDFGDCPQDAAKDTAGNIYMTQQCKNRVAIFNANGQEIGAIGPSEDDHYKFDSPTDIHIDKNGFIYVTDDRIHRVQIYNVNREYAATLSGLNYPYGVVTDSAGRIYVANGGDHKIWVYDKDRNFLTSFGGWADGEYKFRVPRGIAIDQQDRLYIVDGFPGLTEDRLRIYSPLSSEAATKIDTMPPTLNLTAPANGSKITNSLVISGTASDDTMVASISVWMAAAVYGSKQCSSQISITPAATVKFSQDMWSCLPIATFPIGSKITVGVKVLDSSANFTEKSFEVYYEPETADIAPPMIVLTSPQENETVTELVLKGKISDLSGVPEYRVVINDAVENTDCNQLFSFTPQQLEIPLSHSFSQCLKDNTNKIIIHAKDIKGNSVSKQINITKKSAVVTPAPETAPTSAPEEKLKTFSLGIINAPVQITVGKSILILTRANEGTNPLGSVYVKTKIIVGQTYASIYYWGQSLTNINGEQTFNLETSRSGKVTIEFTAEKDGYITQTKTVDIEVLEKIAEEKPKVMELFLSFPATMMVRQGLVWVIAKTTENSQPLAGVYIKSKVTQGQGSIAQLGLSFTDNEGKMTFSPLALAAGTMTFEFTAEKEGYQPVAKKIGIQIIDPTQKETPKKDFKGPSISSGTVVPTQVTQGETVSVSAAVQDQGVGVKQVLFIYKVGGQQSWEGQKQITLSYDSTMNLYKGSFIAPAGYSISTIVHYYFKAQDKNNNETLFPTSAPAVTPYFTLNPSQAPVLPAVVILNLYSDQGVIYLNQGESETAHLHLTTTNIGSATANVQAAITLSTSQKPNFYQAKRTLFSLPNQDQNFEFTVPIDNSFIGQRIFGIATIEDIDRNINLGSGENRNLLEVKRKTNSKVELQITEHWPQKRIYKTGETAEILVALTNSGDISLSNVKVQADLYYSLTRSVFQTLTKEVSSIAAQKTAIVKFPYTPSFVQENQSIGVKITAGNVQYPELAKTGFVDNYFEVRPPAKKNFAIADNIKFEQTGLAYNRLTFSTKVDGVNKWVMALDTKLTLQIKNQNKGLLGGRTLYTNFSVTKVWQDAIGNPQYEEVKNSRVKYELASQTEKTVDFIYDFSQATPGLYQISIRVDKETAVGPIKKYETLFTTGLTLIGRIEGNNLLRTEKNFMLANEALHAYQTLSDVRDLDRSLEKLFGPYRQFASFSLPVVSEFFRMVTGAPDYSDMEDTFGAYSKAGIILVSAKAFGSAMAETLSPILDAVDVLSMAADPRSSGLYQSMQQAADKAWSAGEWMIYETAVSKHKELVDKFKDLYFSSIFKLMEGKIAEAKNLFFIPDANHETADNWVYTYNYNFGFGGFDRDTIYNAYKHYKLDFIIINSAIQDQYLSGTKKGFYTLLP